MGNKLLYQTYFNAPLTTREETHAFIADKACPDSATQKQEIIEQLKRREAIGSTLIADHVMLPHVESKLIHDSQVMFIRLAEPMDYWDDSVEDVRLLIVLLIKEKEAEPVKAKIPRLMRTLADDAYIERLLKAKDSKQFEQEMIKI